MTNGPPITVEHVIDRLNNWKFQQAQDMALSVPVPPNEASYIIAALAQAFGDVGGFDGVLATIVQAATARAIDLLNGKGTPSP